MWLSFAVLVFQSISYLISAEEVQHNNCTYLFPRDSKCTINKVEILPCPEAAENEPCSIYKNTNSTVKFEFTPDFNTTQLYAQAYSASFAIDLPLPGQDTNGCHFTSCPIVAGNKYSFQFSLPIAEYYPSGFYLAKWKIWAANTFEECCFTTGIAIV